MFRAYYVQDWEGFLGLRDMSLNKTKKPLKRLMNPIGTAELCRILQNPNPEVLKH